MHLLLKYMEACAPTFLSFQHKQLVASNAPVLGYIREPHRAPTISLNRLSVTGDIIGSL